MKMHKICVTRSGPVPEAIRAAGRNQSRPDASTKLDAATQRTVAKLLATMRACS